MKVSEKESVWQGLRKKIKVVGLVVSLLWTRFLMTMPIGNQRKAELLRKRLTKIAPAVSELSSQVRSQSKTPEETLRLLEKAAKHPRRVALKPKAGMTYNPLLRLPRNSRCPCQGGKKLKNCCLPNLPALVPESVAEHYEKVMAKFGSNIRFAMKGQSNGIPMAGDRPDSGTGDEDQGGLPGAESRSARALPMAASGLDAPH